MKIDIYTVDYCPYCRKAFAFLEAHGVDFTNHDITENENMMRKELGKKYNIQGTVTVPQIIIDEKRIGGYTDIIEMDKSGLLPF